MAELARSGLAEGIWLRAERQTQGRGRQGRAWESPPGNLHASTLVRLRPADPPPATLALVAGVAVQETVSHVVDGARLKWPNDLLVGAAKVAGILMERVEQAVVVGIGINLAHHPDLPDRATTSLAALDVVIDPATVAEMLAESFERWLARWRGEGLHPIRTRWLKRAHPPGTALTARLPDASVETGLFDGLDQDGALLLRLASGERRVIHAADVFLI